MEAVCFQELEVVELGIIDSNRFGMANRKLTGFDSAVVTSSGRFKPARRQAVFTVV